MFNKDKFLKLFKPQKDSDESSLTFKVSDSLENARAKLSAHIPNLKDKSIADGLRNIPDPKIENLGSTEEEWMQQVQQVVDESHKNIGQNVSELKKDIKNISQKLQTFDLENRENEARKFNQPQEELDIESAKAESESEAHRLDLEIMKLERDSADLTEEKYIEKAGDKKRPTKSLLHSKWIYFGLMTLLGLLEFPVNWIATVKLGESSDFLSMILCFAFAVIICISSHYFGEGLAEKNKVYASGGLLVGLFAIVTILFIRHSIGYAVVLGLFNVALFLAGSLLSYSRSNNLGYFEKDEELEKISVDMIAKKKERKLTDKILSKQLADIEANYKQKATEEAWDEINELETRLKKAEVDYKKLKTYLKGYELSIQDIFEEGVNVYRTTNSRQRFGRYPDVAFWKKNKSIPSLSFNYLKKKDLQKKAKSLKVASAIIPLLSFFFLSSCTSTSIDFDTEIYVIIDKTEQFSNHSDATIKYLEQIAGVDDGDGSGGCILSFSTITSNTFNSKYKVEMKKGKSFFQGKKTNDLKGQSKIFHDSIRSVFYQIDNEPVGRKESEVYAAICKALNELQNSPSISKKLIIMSDLLEHSPSVSFYKYRNKRDAFQKDYDLFRKTFERSCSLPDLSGIDIELIHLPDEDSDHLFDMTLNFWEDLFHKHAVHSFTHTPNL